MPSVSKKQHNFMNAIAHNKAFAKKVGVPQSVGKDFAEADKGKKFKQGGMMKHSDLAQDKKMVKKAVAMHDKQQHGGKKTDLATLKKGGVAKTVTKEMEYDYKSGKKAFRGTTAQRDAHAEKEGKRVAKDLAYDKRMYGGGKVKKMAVGGSTGSFNSTGSNPYAPQMQTGAIGGLDQLNQSIGTIQNALGGAPKNVGESTQMYKRGGKVKKMADGGMPIDPRAVAMAQKQAAMAKGAKRNMPMADPRAPQRAPRAMPPVSGMPQGKPMIGRMPPQAGMPVPTMKKGGEAKAMVKKEVDFMKKKGAPKSMIKHEMAEAGMKKGGMCMARGGGVETKGKTKGKMVKMARGGGIEVRGKTKGTMVKMKGC